jgi:hypothetical protein
LKPERPRRVRYWSPNLALRPELVDSSALVAHREAEAALRCESSW